MATADYTPLDKDSRDALISDMIEWLDDAIETNGKHLDFDEFQDWFLERTDKHTVDT